MKIRNAVDKELKEAVIESGKIAKSNSQAIHPPLVSDQHIKAKALDGAWIVFDCEKAKVLLDTEPVGLFKSHTLIKDSRDHVVATILTEKKGWLSGRLTTWICRSTPAYEGQESLSAEELKHAGLEETTVLYKFSKIETVRHLSTAHAEYSVVTDCGLEETQLLYTADKLPAMNYMALFREGDRVVAKASAQGMSLNPVLDAASGVDLLAIVCMAAALVNNDGTL